MDSAALQAGVQVDDTIFRIDDSIARGVWQASIVGTNSSRTYDHAIDPLNMQSVEAERVWKLKMVAYTTQLLVVAASDLRDRLCEVVEGLEAKARHGEEEKPDPKCLSFSGKVTLGDNDPYVGGVAVLPSVAKKFGRGEPMVEVYLGVEAEAATTHAGPIEAHEGWEGTDKTSGDVPKIEVGSFDLLAKLRDLEGRHVELVVREVQRPGPFLIEVDPSLRPESWLVPDLRWSAAFRADADLNGDILRQLAKGGAGHIVVSFASYDAVTTAIDGYQRIERELGEVLPAIEVVPGKGRATGTGNVTVAASLALENLATQLGLTTISPSVVDAACRAVLAHRRGKLLLVLDPDDEKGLANRDEQAWHKLLRAINEAKMARDTVHVEVVEDEEPKPETFTLHEGDELSVYVDSDFGVAQWRTHGWADHGSRLGGFTVAAIREAIDHSVKEITVSEDLMPNAMAALVAIGEIADRDVREWAKEVEDRRVSSR